MLSISTYSNLLLTNLQSKSYQNYNFNGSALPYFTAALATGIVNTAISLNGNIAVGTGSGVSTGTGIHISGSNIALSIRNQAAFLFGSEGPALPDFCNVIGDVTATAFLSATLESTTNGSATFASFSSAIETMSENIKNSVNFTGSQWSNFCTAIATGICTEIANNGTATLTGALGPGGVFNAPVVIS